MQSKIERASKEGALMDCMKMGALKGNCNYMEFGVSLMINLMEN